MGVNDKALRDELLTLLSGDSALATLLGTGNRIHPGYSLADVDGDAIITSDTGMLIVGAISTETNYMQSSDIRVTTTSYGAYDDKISEINNRVVELIEGFKPTVVWCQQFILELTQPIEASTVSRDKQQGFARSIFMAKARRR